MRLLICIIFTLLTTVLSGQSKYDYIQFDQIIELQGTDYVIATIENRGKALNTNSEHLLFINTSDGKTKQIEFPAQAYVHTIEQVKIDSLQINKVIVSARTVNLDNNKSIDWEDPYQIIILSTDGQQKTQLTEDNFFSRTWAINRRTGAITIAGHYDSNQNGKYDKSDKNVILIYDLATLKLTAKI
jgi:hypothetical protein